jgi:hypothetical protein
MGSVKTYREGFLRLQGWMTFSGLAFFTAGLAVMFEVRRDKAAAAPSPFGSGFISSCVTRMVSLQIKQHA